MRAGRLRIGTAGLIAGGLVAGLWACGGSPTTSDPRSILGEGEFRNLGVYPPDYFVQVFSLGTPGIVDATVDWRSAVNNIDVVIMQGDCLAARLNCPTVAQAQSFEKPERVVTGNLSGGTYSLVILNRGPGAESGRYEVGVTR